MSCVWEIHPRSSRIESSQTQDCCLVKLSKLGKAYALILLIIVDLLAMLSQHALHCDVPTSCSTVSVICGSLPWHNLRQWAQNQFQLGRACDLIMQLTLILVMKMVVFTTASMEDPRPARVAFRLSIACMDVALQVMNICLPHEQYSFGISCSRAFIQIFRSCWSAWHRICYQQLRQEGAQTAEEKILHNKGLLSLMISLCVRAFDWNKVCLSVSLQRQTAWGKDTKDNLGQDRVFRGWWQSLPFWFGLWCQLHLFLQSCRSDRPEMLLGWRLPASRHPGVRRFKF